MMRIALGIEYDGTAYNGWQRQRNGVGVQLMVEQALSEVANSSIDVTCAGRTDTGVHASGQVVHFDSEQHRPCDGWLMGANRHLPNDINVTWAQQVDRDFHARFSAQARHYRYCILNRLARSSLARHRAWWIHAPLDEKRMQEAATSLLGEHDFSAFRAAACQAASPQRTISKLSVERHQDWITIEIHADGFLQRMVRIITGTLATVGTGEKPPAWVSAVLKSRDRKHRGSTAPAHGLTLTAVLYPDHFGLAQSVTGPGQGDIDGFRAKDFRL